MSRHTPVARVFRADDPTAAATDTAELRKIRSPEAKKRRNRRKITMRRFRAERRQRRELGLPARPELLAPRPTPRPVKPPPDGHETGWNTQPRALTEVQGRGPKLRWEK